MKTSITVGLLAALVFLAGCQQFSAEESGTSNVLEAQDGDVAVPLAELPETVKLAALAAVPGLVISEAERETEDGSVVFCVHGTVDGQPYEVEVGPDGSVLEIEQDGDDDDGHDEHSDDEDD